MRRSQFLSTFGRERGLHSRGSEAKLRSRARLDMPASDFVACLASIFRRLSGLIRGRYWGLASAFAIGLRFFFTASPSFRHAVQRTASSAALPSRRRRENAPPTSHARAAATSRLSIRRLRFPRSRSGSPGQRLRYSALTHAQRRLPKQVAAVSSRNAFRGSPSIRHDVRSRPHPSTPAHHRQSEPGPNFAHHSRSSLRRRAVRLHCLTVTLLLYWL